MKCNIQLTNYVLLANKNTLFTHYITVGQCLVLTALVGWHLYIGMGFGVLRGPFGFTDLMHAPITLH